MAIFTAETLSGDHSAYAVLTQNYWFCTCKEAAQISGYMAKNMSFRVQTGLGGNSMRACPCRLSHPRVAES